MDSARQHFRAALYRQCCVKDASIFGILEVLSHVQCKICKEEFPDLEAYNMHVLEHIPRLPVKVKHHSVGIKKRARARPASTKGNHGGTCDAMPPLRPSPLSAGVYDTIGKAQRERTRTTGEQNSSQGRRGARRRQGARVGQRKATTSQADSDGGEAQPVERTTGASVEVDSHGSVPDEGRVGGDSGYETGHEKLFGGGGDDCEGQTRRATRTSTPPRVERDAESSWSQGQRSREREASRVHAVRGHICIGTSEHAEQGSSVLQGAKVLGEDTQEVGDLNCAELSLRQDLGDDSQAGAPEGVPSEREEGYGTTGRSGDAHPSVSGGTGHVVGADSVSIDGLNAPQATRSATADSGAIPSDSVGSTLRVFGQGAEHSVRSALEVVERRAKTRFVYTERQWHLFRTWIFFSTGDQTQAVVH